MSNRVVGAAWRAREVARDRLRRAAETNVGLLVVVPALTSIVVGASPGADFWQDGVGRVISVAGPTLTALGVAALAQSQRFEVAERERYHERSRLCQAIALTVAQEIDGDKPPLPAIGVHVWEPRGAGSARSLQLVTTYGLDPALPVGVVFTPDKGVIGSCWSQKSEQFLDNEKERKLAEQLGPEGFDARRDREPGSLPYSEFRRFEHFSAFYAEDFVVDHSQRVRFVGCISIDARRPVTPEQLRSVVRREGRSKALQGLIGEVYRTFVGKRGA